MIENIVIVVGSVVGIIFCIVLMILSIQNYIIIKKQCKNEEQKSEKERLDDVIRFYILATQLKYKIRSGWDEKHWHVSKERLESVAEHVYGTCILALSIYSEFQVNYDINKVIQMLILHELGEVIIGDITPYDNITPEEKAEKEHEAMKDILGNLIMKDEYLSLLLEFDEKKSNEAIFAHHCDKLEADIQAKVYQDMGCQNPLNQQKNNVVFNSQKVQQIIRDGAKSTFDIWYEYDKHLYDDDEKFAKILDYVKDIDTQNVINI